VSRARHWVRRVALSALTGGGLTAAGVSGSLGGAQAAEAPTGPAPDAQPPTSLSPPQEHGERTTGTTTTSTTTTPTTPTPAPSAPSGGGSAQQQQTTTTNTVSSSQAPKPIGPKGVHQHRQPGTENVHRKPSRSTTRKPAVAPKPSALSTSSTPSGAQATGNVAPAPGLLASGALVPSPLLSGSLASMQALSFYRIPLFLLPIYQAAAAQYGVPWQVLAAINEVETDYGADQSVSTAGAVGWMQFMPETWLQYGVDAVNAGYADPYNPVDAIFAAARYLHAAGASSNLAAAILAYNHSQAYVQSVLLRARLISSYPSSVIATLTGLTEGSLPVQGAKLLAVGRSLSSPAAGAQATGANQGSGQARSAQGQSTSSLPGSAPAPAPALTAGEAEKQADAPTPLAQLSELSAPRDAPVLAVEDGKIVALGRSRSLGEYLVLRDTYGDVFTYASLGSLAPSFQLPKPAELTVPKGALRGAEGTEAAPKQAATAGRQAPLTLHVALRAKGAASPAGRAGSPESSIPPARADTGKVRVFAHPGNRDALAAARARAGRTRSSSAGSQALRRGSVVAQGTVLGRVRSVGGSSTLGTLRFAVRPAGAQRAIDPGPVLRNWAQLDAALHPQGARTGDVLAGATAADAFDLSAAQLERAVLADPGIRLGACDRQQVASGKVDRRMLALLVFMSRSGLKPTVEQLRCGHLIHVGGAASVSYLPRGSLTISAVNGVPIAGHQGPGSIADVTIRTLLTVRRPFAAAQIVSLMQYPGAPATVARPDHGGQLEIVLAPMHVGRLAKSAKRSSVPSETVLDSEQWTKLIGQIGSIASPKVARKPSAAAIRDRKAG
jgi:hypothetical protein